MLCGLLTALLLALPICQEGGRPGTSAAPTKSGGFAVAQFEEIAREREAEAARGEGSRAPHRHLTVEWPGLVSLFEKRPIQRREAVLDRVAATPIAASHALSGDPETRFELDAEARLEVGGLPFELGRVSSTCLREGEALFDARADATASAPALRVFGLARRIERDRSDKKPRLPLLTAPVRRASVYPRGESEERLDVYFIRDAAVASESLPSADNFSIAGAGDRPRRFMRGHRFTYGDRTVIALRYADPHGGSLRLSIEVPARRFGTFELPGTAANAAVTELPEDPEAGRITESIRGRFRFEEASDSGATLELCLDVRLRRVGARDPERLLVFGEFFCTPVPIDELTPWLGRTLAGRPLLDAFALPGPYDP